MKKLNYLLISGLILLSNYSSAQTTPADQDTSWKKGGFIGVAFSQVNLSNWAQGGENSMSLAGNGIVFANYAKEKIEWANDLTLNYAVVRSGKDYTKSDDRIELNSKLGKKLGESKWLFSFLMNFKTQLGPGYNYPNDSVKISDIFSPAYLTLSAGFTWKPVDYFEVMISPATGKFTFVNDPFLSDIGAYGVDTGKTFRSEFGAYLNLRFKKDIIKNVNLLSKLELFNNYSDKNKDNASKVDVFWDSYLNMKINDFLTASLNFLVIYDANVVEKTQLKEMFGVGLGYKFGYIPPEKK